MSSWDTVFCLAWKLSCRQDISTQKDVYSITKHNAKNTCYSCNPYTGTKIHPQDYNRWRESLICFPRREVSSSGSWRSATRPDVLWQTEKGSMGFQVVTIGGGNVSSPMSPSFLQTNQQPRRNRQLLGVLTYRGHRLVPIAVVLAAATGNLSTNYPNLELEEQGWEPLKGVFTTLPGCSLKHKALEAHQRKIHWIVKLGAELASNTFWNCYGHRITSKTQTEKLEAKSRDSKTVSIQETSEGL